MRRPPTPVRGHAAFQKESKTEGSSKNERPPGKLRGIEFQRTSLMLSTPLGAYYEIAWIVNGSTAMIMTDANERGRATYSVDRVNRFWLLVCRSTLPAARG